MRDPNYAWLPASVVSVNADHPSSSAPSSTSSLARVRIDLPEDWYDTTHVPKTRKRGWTPVPSSSPSPSPRGGAQPAIVEDGTILTVSLDDYDNSELPPRISDDDDDGGGGGGARGGWGRGKADMADLPHLHEAAVLYNLKDRHGGGAPYTRVGGIVVAVNPYKVR